MGLLNLASNWNFNLQALAKRFPYASAEDLTLIKDEPVAMTRVLARSHDLTEPEAREELENFLDLEALARAASDIRSHDAALVSAE